MPDRNVLIHPDGTPSDPAALITKKKKVTFHPSDSDQTITVTFDTRVPFSDWGSSSQTGKKGKAIKGKVDEDATGEYSYSAVSDPGTPQSRSGSLANPKLIVDGGLIPPGQHRTD